MIKFRPPAVLLSIAALAIALIINFEGLVFGGSASFVNLAVSLLYILTWLIISFSAYRRKSAGELKYTLIYWLITLIVSLLTVYVNYTDALLDWAIPLVIVFLGPLYGLGFFYSGLWETVLTLAMLATALCLINGILMKKLRRRTDKINQ